MSVVRTPVTTQIIDVSPTSDSIVFGVDLQSWLPSGVTVSDVGDITQTNDGGQTWEAEDSTNTIGEIEDIAVASVAANANAMTNHLGGSVPANNGITGIVSGGTNGALYYVTIPVTLSDSQVFDVVQRFRVTRGY